MKKIRSVKPPITIAVDYARDVRRELKGPVIDLSKRLAAAGSSYQALLVQLFPFTISNSSASSFIARLDAYHRRRFESIMRIALGVRDVPFGEGHIYENQLRLAIKANIDLINTLPARHIAMLRAEIMHLNNTVPFDRQAVAKAVRRTGMTTSSNVTRIARDQTSKMVGKFNELRQVGVGIQYYQWSSSSDRRTRPTHAANDGQFFQWSNPPGTGHPGSAILCRCSAVGVIQ